MTIQSRIQIIFEELGVSQKEMIRRGAGSSQTISNIYNGKQKPNYIFLETLLKEFEKINARWLITGQGEMLTSEKNDINTEQVSDNGKDLLHMLMEKSEECGVLRTKLEHAKGELSKLRAGGHDQEPDEEGARAG